MSNLRNNWRSFLNYSLPRTAITVLVYIFLFNNVKDASYIIGNIDFGYGRITAGWSLVVASAFIVIVIWLTYDVLVSIASSLGYRGGDSRGFVINGNTGVINLPSGDKAANRDFNNKQKFQIIQYEAGKPLFALSQARERIHYHIDRLQNSSIVNLFIGIAIAFIGIGTIGSTFFEIEKYADKNSGFNTTGFLIFALLPRLSIALIVQVFRSFFL